MVWMFQRLKRLFLYCLLSTWTVFCIWFLISGEDNHRVCLGYESIDQTELFGWLWFWSPPNIRWSKSCVPEVYWLLLGFLRSRRLSKTTSDNFGLFWLYLITTSKCISADGMGASDSEVAIRLECLSQYSGVSCSLCWGSPMHCPLMEEKFSQMGEDKGLWPMLPTRLTHLWQSI